MTSDRPTQDRTTHDEVLAVVQGAVATVLELPAESVTRDTSFRDDLQADSLALVEIVEIVEEALAPRARPGFRIEDDDLDRLATVGEAVDYALARL
jgi:acyl carrier protein